MKNEEVERADNLSHRKNRSRRGIGMSKKTAVGIFAVLIAGTLIASGALLSYYGSIQTTATVEQSVVISEDGSGWQNYDTPISRDLGEVVSCNDYTYKAWIWNRACSEAPVEIVDVCTAAPNGNDPEGFDITHYIFGDTQTIELRQKTVDFGTTNWPVINEETIGADVTIDTCAKQFHAKIDYWGLDTVEYSLIYYKDTDPRWDGEGIAKVLHAFTPTTSDGTATWTSQSTAYEAFPDIDDWNAGPDAHYTASDGYDHAKGAKLWIVPSSELSGSSVSWTNADNFLLETDLALHIDCDDMSPPWLQYVYPLFATTILQPESEYCWLTNYHVDLAIWPGIYAFNTWLNPN